MMRYLNFGQRVALVMLLVLVALVFVYRLLLQGVGSALVTPAVAWAFYEVGKGIERARNRRGK